MNSPVACGITMGTVHIRTDAACYGQASRNQVLASEALYTDFSR